MDTDAASNEVADDDEHVVHLAQTAHDLPASSQESGIQTSARFGVLVKALEWIATGSAENTTASSEVQPEKTPAAREEMQLERVADVRDLMSPNAPPPILVTVDGTVSSAFGEA